MCGVKKEEQCRLDITLELAMQKVSTIISVPAFLFMICGSAVLALRQKFYLPDSLVVPQGELLHPGNLLSGQGLLNLGILMLAASPAIRVFTALVVYVRIKAWVDAIIALGVLMVLIFSCYVPTG